MKLFQLLIVLLVTSLLPGTSGLAANYIPYDAQVVGTIQVEPMGKVQVSEKDRTGILNRLTTRRGSLFSQAQFDQDLKSLAQDYDLVEPVVTSNQGKIQIVLRVWPKPLVRSICFQGNRSVSEKELRNELNVAACTVFDRSQFTAAFQKLKTFYVKKGFFESELSYSIARDDTCNEVDIIIKVKEGRSGRIRNLCFSGLDDREVDDLIDLMVTKPWNIFIGVFSEGGQYNDDMIQYDQYQVINYLQNKGYADATCKIEVCEASKPFWIDVHVHACKGTCYTFGEVSYEGNCLFTDETIEKLICIHEGAPFSPDAIRDTMKNLHDAYGSKGYIEAIFDDEVTLQSEKPVYNFHVSIEEGEQFRVGLIKIFGNNYTQNRVILHETLLVPGEVFNTIKLRFTEERLRNIGYFKTVNVYAVRSSRDSCLGDQYRDVHIEVEEDSTGNFGAFLGFSTGDDIFGGFNITEKNFNIEGLSFASLEKKGLRGLKGGGEYAHFTATYGQKTSSYVLSWTKPYFRDTPWSVGVDLEKKWNGMVSRDYDIYSYSLGLHAKRCLNAFVTLGTHYRLRNSYVQVDAAAKRESEQLREAANIDGLISGVGFSLIYNSTNHPLQPTKGYRSRLEGEFVGLGGDNHFFSFGYVNSLFHPFGHNGVIRLRADAKFIQPLDIPKPGEDSLSTIPIDERLMLGGDYMVRGYRPYQIGPTFKKNDGKNQTDDPRGGLSLVLLSLEYTKPLFRPLLDMFFFTDAGYLTEKSWHINTDALKCSVGLGVKLHLMGAAPPVILGYGFPLNPSSDSEVKNFFISMGARF